MAEIKALASGNPKIMERVMAQNEIVKLEQLRLLLANERRGSQRCSPVTRKNSNKPISVFATWVFARKCVTRHTSDQFTMKVDGKEYTERKLAGQQLIEMAHAVKLDASAPAKKQGRPLALIAVL